MAEQNIIVYHYAFSPYARRITWYLALRGVRYTECEVSPYMPRPELETLGVRYRRIPVVAIGRDVYLDSRLIYPKLEALKVSQPRLGSSKTEHRAIEELLSAYINDRGIFGRVAQLLPEDLPLMKDAKFVNDRHDFFTTMKFTPESRLQARPEALIEMAGLFNFLERRFFSDDRTWILDTPGPSLADIEAVWPINFILEIEGALPKDKFSADVYPKVFAWVERFRKAVEDGKAKLRDPQKLTGDEAKETIVKAPYYEPEGGIDDDDFELGPLKVKKGDVVTVGPTDFGSSRRDTGKLVSANQDEVVLEAGSGNATFRLHAPRHQFSIGK